VRGRRAQQGTLGTTCSSHSTYLQQRAQGHQHGDHRLHCKSGRWRKQVESALCTFMTTAQAMEGNSEGTRPPSAFTPPPPSPGLHASCTISAQWGRGVAEVLRQGKACVELFQRVPPPPNTGVGESAGRSKVQPCPAALVAK